MPLEVKQFNCPKCGSPLSIKNAGRSKSIVCPSCNSQIDLTGPEYQVVVNVGPRPEPTQTKFTIGMQGTLQGQAFEIIGRVRYRDDENYTWDEWLLLSAAGDYRWLSDDAEEGMVLWHAFTPTQPLDPNTVRDGQTINLGDGPARVTEVGVAIIDYLEGELTWKAAKGESMHALDAQGAGGAMFSIEWTADEVEFYRGGRQNSAEAAAAFGVPRGAAVGVASGGGAAAGKRHAPLAVVMIVALVIIMLCVCVGAAVGAGGGGSDCAATPEAVRSSDCSSSFFGGGSGGGFGGSGSSGGK
jgi:Domain of unknown function (DUF4178)